MALDYPDVLNDLTDARSRYESGAVQYLAELACNPVPAGQAFQVALFLQNVVAAQADVSIHLELPAARGKLRRLPQPLFEVYQPNVRLTLESAEVAQIVVPMRVHALVPPGEYELRVGVQSATPAYGERVRQEQMPNRVGDFLIGNPQGLGIAQIASWGFESAKKPEQTIRLQVTELQEPSEEVDLKPRFSSLWTPQDWHWIPEARREANERRAYTVGQLSAERLYLAFLRETQSVFSGIGVQLHVGEAIFIAKMLTYTVTYMMGKSEWQDCLLVPIYAYAQANGQHTDDAVWLVTSLGYTHSVALAITVAFALLENGLERVEWGATEQVAVREFVVECLEGSKSLPHEFLYLPLILGGMAVAREVRFGEENVQESLRLLNQAKREKAEVFADPDLKDINMAYDRLVRKYARG